MMHFTVILHTPVRSSYKVIGTVTAFVIICITKTFIKKRHCQLHCPNRATLYEHGVVSNHQQLNRLFNSLFKLTPSKKKYQNSASTDEWRSPLKKGQSCGIYFHDMTSSCHCDYYISDYLWHCPDKCHARWSMTVGQSYIMRTPVRH